MWEHLKLSEESVFTVRPDELDAPPSRPLWNQRKENLDLEMCKNVPSPQCFYGVQTLQSLLWLVREDISDL